MSGSLARRLASVLLAVPLVSSSAFAASQGVVFEHLTVESGLSSNFVQSVLKDSRGFLWFGTQDGLNRYDGAGFRVYRHDPEDPSSLPSSVAGVLFEDSRKRLWVGSGWGNAGLSLYDRGRDSFVRFDVKPGGSSGNNVRAIAEDRDGRLWLGTDNGIAGFDPETGAMERFPLLPDSRAGELAALVIALFFDSQDRFWVGSSGGLLQFDRQSRTYRRWPAPDNEASSLARADVWAFCPSDEGKLWIATMGGGLHHLDVSSGSDVVYLPDPHDPDSITNERVTRLVSDGQGKVYVGTANGGLNVLDLPTRRFTRFLPEPEDDTALSSGSIWSLLFDDQGILWVGTFNGGVDVLSPAGQRFRHLRAGRGGLNDQHVSAVMEDHRGNLWIGTDGGGLNRRDAKTGVLTYYRHDPTDPASIGSDAIWAVLEDSQRHIWVGGWEAGLGLLDPVSGRFTRFRTEPGNPASLVDNHVWRILELKTGELLIATQGGANLFDRTTRTFKRLTTRSAGEGQDVIYSGAEDARGNLWLVGNTFVGHVDRTTGQVTRYQNHPQDPDRLGHGWTQAVLVDSAGNVWFGTEGGLSCLVSGGERWKRYTTADGLPNNTITSIQEDEAGHLWVATNRGISRLADAVRVPERPSFLNFDVHDGLQSLEFARNASFRGKNGVIYFGGPRGLNSFRPSQIQQNLTPPPITFTDLRLSGRSVRPGAAGSPLVTSMPESETLTLSHRQPVVTFEFAALNYLAPGKNTYAYLLEGFEPDWSYVGTQRTATYTNLPQGSYTLRVRAANNDGVWNQQGAALKLRVLPPWWKAPWFLVLSGAVIVAGVLGAYRARVRSIESLRAREAEIARQYRDQLEALVLLRTRELAEAQAEIVRRERLSVLGQLTATVSHELRNPLGTVRNSIFSIGEALERGQNERVGRALALAERNVRRCDAIITDLLDFTRQHELHRESTPVDEWLAALLDEQAPPRGVALTRELSYGGSASIDRERLRRAVVNVLTNAFHALEGGDRPDKQIRVSTSGAGGVLTIVVADNGPGIPDDLRARVFEPLFSTKAFGVGLGLPIVKAIMEDHGGGVRIDDGAGLGATVKLWLPLL
jgi:signal transduction histidine kinase/ligand-binding sensor domain-containing protein